MGLTKDYLKFVPSGLCNLIGSPNGSVQFVDALTCAVIASERIIFYNVRTLEKRYQIVREGKIVTSFKLSTDKNLIAIGYNDGEIHIYQRGEEVVRSVFSGHRTGVNCIAFSTDGFTIASGGKDSTIVVWDLINETGICRLTGHKSTITSLQFAQQDRFLISSSKDTLVKFWSIASKWCFYTLASSASEVYTFALLNHDRLLVLGNAEIELLVYELIWEENYLFLDDLYKKEEAFKNKKRKDQQLTSVVADLQENEHLEQANNVIRCKKRGVLIRQAKGRALQLAISSDDALLCCVGSDSIIDIYRSFTDEESRKRHKLKLKKIRQKMNTEQQDSELMAKLENEVDRDVTTLITRIGDFRTNSKLKWVDICEGFSELQKNVREYRFFCLMKSNDVQGIALHIDWKRNTTNAVPLISLGQRSHRSDVRTLSIASDASFFVSGSNESAIVWNMESLLAVNKLSEEGLEAISASMIVVGDKQLLLGTKTGSIFLFDLLSCDLLDRYEKAHDATISVICAFPSKNDGFLSCGHDKQARFWQFELLNESDGRKRLTAKSKRILELPDEILCAAISSDCKFAVFGLLDNTARVFYMDSLKFFISLYGHSLPVYCIDISMDSKLVVTGSGDKTVKIWGLDFGDCHKSLFAHDDIVTCVLFAKEMVDEQLFWSAGKDGKLKQWDANKFHRIQTLEAHTAHIDAIALSRDGRTLISASRDKTVRLWELSDEIIVLQEEEEKDREKEYEQKLVDEEDIIPGEPREAIAEGLAPLKSIESVKSTESIMEAIGIVRKERLDREQAELADHQQHKVHPLLMSYPDRKEHRFILDIVHKIQHSLLEKSLLTLPFEYVPDLLSEMGKSIRCNYKPEVAARVVLFLIKVHHSQVIHSLELLSLVDELRMILPKQINHTLNNIGFNIAALRFLQMQLEDRKNTKLFEVHQTKKTSRKKKKRRRAVSEIVFV